MDRFLLFTFYAGRPCGGAGDLVDCFASVEDALENLLPERGRWYQVLDAETLKVVKEGLALYKDFTPESFHRKAA